ncbi:hypothetical protein AN958_02197 [Leucoagaricus sp. SymC.cos]|nr:hypothetical protein AN958_02197 [Leucoagaricus sp. SymC.cos]
MVALTLFTLAASLVGFAAADLQITNPSSSSWWVAQSANNLAWTCHDSPADNFTVMITNTNPSVLSGSQAIIAIQSNFDCSKLITQEQSAHTPATGYQILFANPFNATQIYAQSEQFEIKPLGSAYPATTSNAGASPTGSGSAAGASGTGTSNGKNGATSLKNLGLGFSVAVAAGVSYFM